MAKFAIIVMMAVIAEMTPVTAEIAVELITDFIVITMDVTDTQKEEIGAIWVKKTAKELVMAKFAIIIMMVVVAQALVELVLIFIAITMAVTDTQMEEIGAI